MNRRYFLMLNLTAVAAFIANESPFSGRVIDSSEWDLGSLKFLSPGQSVDLVASLPPGVKSGGKFFIDPKGAQLPEGLTLSETGVLSVCHSVSSLNISDVVFCYRY